VLKTDIPFGPLGSTPRVEPRKYKPPTSLSRLYAYVALLVWFTSVDRACCGFQPKYNFSLLGITYITVASLYCIQHSIIVEAVIVYQTLEPLKQIMVGAARKQCQAHLPAAFGGYPVIVKPIDAIGIIGCEI